MLILTAKNLGIYIRSHRKSQDLSQAEVGDSVGLKQGTVSDFENKTERAKIETLFRILSATNLEIHLIPKGQKNVAQKNAWDEEW